MRERVKGILSLLHPTPQHFNTLYLTVCDLIYICEPVTFNTGNVMAQYNDGPKTELVRNDVFSYKLALGEMEKMRDGHDVYLK